SFRRVLWPGEWVLHPRIHGCPGFASGVPNLRDRSNFLSAAQARDMNSKFKWIVLIAALIASGGALAYFLFPQDELHVLNVAGADVPVILLDGKQAACVNENAPFSRRGTNVKIGNFVPPGTCTPAAVTVLAQQNALQYESPYTPWTTNASDIGNV